MADPAQDDNYPGVDVSPSAEDLSSASKTAFNERAWNDPPPLLMATGAGTRLADHVDTPRPRLTERVAYPISGPAQAPAGSSSATTNSPPAALNPSGPPPTSGFVAASKPPLPKKGAQTPPPK